MFETEIEKRKARARTMGGILFVLSLLGIIYGARTVLAQSIYFSVKYGDLSGHNSDVRSVIRRAEMAHRLYPRNYLLCIWTADKAWVHRWRLPELTEMAERVEIAHHWCDEGLKLNFFKSQLRRLKTKLLRRGDPKAAARYWEEFTDWQFWEPYNHAVLVDLYSGTGDIAKAARALEWVGKNSPHYREAADKLREAWKREMQPPNIPPRRK